MQIIIKLHERITINFLIKISQFNKLHIMTSIPIQKTRILKRKEFFNYIELNITGDDSNFNKCDSESSYIDADIFNIYTNCFEASNSLFEFYGNTKYNSRNIIRLKNELEILAEKIVSIKTTNELEAFINSFFLGKEILDDFKKHYTNWEEHWIEIKDILIQFNNDLFKVVNKCITEDRVLWVIGL